MDSEDECIKLLIYRAVFHNDWKFVSETFEKRPELLNKTLNRRLETPLMVAVGSNRSPDFVKKLLCALSKDVDLIHDALAAKNDQGDTALHYAAKVENVNGARLLVSHSSNLQDIVFHKNNGARSPLSVAACHGKKSEVLEYLFSELRVLNPTTLGVKGYDIMRPAIEGEFLDLALKLAKTHSDIFKSESYELQRVLNLLAKNPKLFRNGISLEFWNSVIYSLMPVDMSKIIPAEDKTTSQQYAQDEESIYIEKEFPNIKSTSKVWFKRILRYIASPIMDIYDMKLTHRQANELLKCVCKSVFDKPNKHVAATVFESAMDKAVKFANFEVIEEIMDTCPFIVGPDNEGFDLLHQAIKQRQDRIYNLLYQITRNRVYIASHINEEQENVLHIVAKSPPSHRLKIMSGGAALQMQRELQWYKEIETNLVEPSYEEAVNKNGETPRMVFSKEHENMLEEGQKWMKKTATSSSVVAALIVTVAFAAAFTVPGGNKNEGNPVYLDKGAFMVFIISDAVALFSSVTSVLMSLGILTSRYAEEDFLYTLPTRMTIGLISLFVSLAATMVAFSATLALVLQDHKVMKWIAAPLVIITCIPVGVFALLQFPLLIQLVYSTYGPSIFNKKKKKKTKLH